MNQIRLSAPEYLPVRPLTWGFEHGLGTPRVQFTFSSLKACTENLRTGKVELALVPLQTLRTLGQTMDLRIVPNVAVASKGDTTTRENPDETESWRLATGLPFVHYVWAGMAGILDEEILTWIQDSAQQGLKHRGEIVQAFIGLNGITTAHTELQLFKRVYYQLGAAELSGATAFLEQLRLTESSKVSTRIRFFDQAYQPELPSSVSWPPSIPSGNEPSIDGLLADAASGQRLTPEMAIRLYDHAPLLDLGAAADLRRKSLHPSNVVTYIIDRNVNYTNICVTACKFCNFFRTAKSKEGYTLDQATLAQKFQETVDLEGIQVLLQGGVNPQLPLTYYEDLFRFTKANFPLALHALSPEEISCIAQLENLSIRQVLERLIAAGLDSLPGAGAEILDDEIRHRISPLKCSTDTWMQVMREAHALGLRTTATLVFGFGEHAGHLVRHLERLRALQDQTAGFTAFICWPFQAEGTRLRLADDTSPARYLRILALSRLYLDNFPNLQVSWPTLGPAIGQVGLRFGGNDFGSAMIEENVVSQAGAVFKLSALEIEAQIRGAGFTPRRRNMRYEYVLQEQEILPFSKAI
jgi:cyclic dehypoxanthinyl futalosine synthase